MSKMITARPWACLAVLAALFVAGCGGGNDEDQIREVVTQLGNSDPAVCDNMTDKFLKNVGGSVDKCKKQAEDSKEKTTIKVTSVKVDGDKATANISVENQKGTASFVKDGDWKIDEVKDSASASSGSDDTKTAETTTAPEASGPGETEARGAVDAFLTAVNQKDEQVLCGLLSEDYAKKILNKPQAKFAIADCVEAFKKFDWSGLQKEAKGVSVKSVAVVGDSAAVILSDNETVNLKKDGDRFVIDNIHQ